MADQTPTEANQAFNQARADRLGAAISQALAAKVPAAPKPSKGGSTRPSTAGAAPASSTAAATDAAAIPASTESSPTQPDDSTPASGAAPSPAELGLDTAEPAEGEPQDGAAEGPESGPDATAAALGKKRDLRGLEKHLGLPEGHLGTQNGDWASYRRRLGEVEARAQEVEATHASNNATLIGKFGPVVDLIGLAQKGDLQAYAQLVERTTGVRIAQFVDHWSKNMPRLDPRVMQLERENAELKAQRQPAATPEPPAAGAVTADAATQRANTYLSEAAKGHAALSLKGGLDEVRAKWLGSYKPGKGFGLSPQAAADAVVADRRAQREQEGWVLSGKTPPKRPVTRALPRTGASEARVRERPKVDLSAKEGRERLIEEGAAMVRRQKARDAALGTRR